MGIQINGQTDTISAVDGALTVSGAELPTVTNLNATGISTFSKGIVIGTGTSISSPTTNTLTLGTNNAERVRVSAGGVSIGTVSTYGDSNASFTSLSLGGNGTRYGLLEIKQSNSVAGSWIDCYGTNGNGDLRITTAGTSNKITFWTGGAFTEKVCITSDGNLGIGITNPSQKFEVVGGEIKAGRVDSTNEGGQVSFGRATDNATGWYIDVYGNTSTPSLRFVDVSNAAVRATIDGSGRLTLPYQPMFQAYGVSGGTFATGNYWIFPSTFVNIGNHYNTSNGIFTAPIAGTYKFWWSFIGGNQSDVYRYTIHKNNSSLSSGTPQLRIDTSLAGTEYGNGNVTVIISLSTNDTVRIYFSSDSGNLSYPFGNSSVDAYVLFGGMLLG
jgi:hypothetical protein